MAHMSCRSKPLKTTTAHMFSDTRRDVAAHGPGLELDPTFWVAVKELKWGFPKIRGTILGVPIIRIIVYWCLYWGPLILGNYQIKLP